MTKAKEVKTSVIPETSQEMSKKRRTMMLIEKRTKGIKTPGMINVKVSLLKANNILKDEGVDHPIPKEMTMTETDRSRLKTKEVITEVVETTLTKGRISEITRRREIIQRAERNLIRILLGTKGIEDPDQEAETMTKSRISSTRIGKEMIMGLKAIKMAIETSLPHSRKETRANNLCKSLRKLITMIKGIPQSITRAKTVMEKAAIKTEEVVVIEVKVQEATARKTATLTEMATDITKVVEASLVTKELSSHRLKETMETKVPMGIIKTSNQRWFTRVRLSLSWLKKENSEPKSLTVPK